MIGPPPRFTLFPYPTLFRSLIFIIPNVDETVRVNGRAFLTADPELMQSMAIQGKAPKLGIVVEIDEVYMHCARAFLRSGMRSEEHTSELQSRQYLVCRLLLE